MPTTINSFTEHARMFVYASGQPIQIATAPTDTSWADFEDYYARQTFAKLADEWLAQKGPISSISKKVMLRPYQRIIGLGSPVVPLLLKELQQKPDHWFWALESITGENPVSETDQGNIEQMSEAWVRWGRERGYL